LLEASGHVGAEMDPQGAPPVCAEYLEVLLASASVTTPKL
jgi:hypothetical protein